MAISVMVNFLLCTLTSPRHTSRSRAPWRRVQKAWRSMRRSWEKDARQSRRGACRAAVRLKEKGGARRRHRWGRVRRSASAAVRPSSLLATVTSSLLRRACSSAGQRARHAAGERSSCSSRCCSAVLLRARALGARMAATGRRDKRKADCMVMICECTACSGGLVSLLLDEEKTADVNPHTIFTHNHA